jgi:hypothetical protein
MSRFTRHDIGVALAVFAGFTTLALILWPVLPQAGAAAPGVEVGAWWSVGLLVAGVCFLAAPFVVEGQRTLARLLLMAPGAAMIAFGIGWMLFQQVGHPLTGLVDVVPGTVACVAGLLIGPYRRGVAGSKQPPEESAHDEAPLPRPDESPDRERPAA